MRGLRDMLPLQLRNGSYFPLDSGHPLPFLDNVDIPLTMRWKVSIGLIVIIIQILVLDFVTRHRISILQIVLKRKVSLI